MLTYITKKDYLPPLLGSKNCSKPLNPRNLLLKAGPAAKKILLERGLRKEDIKIIPAAAGGPKWLILYHLDQYIFNYWLQDTSTLIELFGASAGAWRMACASQTQVKEALMRFKDAYVNQTYEDAPSPAEVSDTCRQIVNQFLGEEGTNQILTNPKFKLNVITSSSKFDYQSDSLKRDLYKAALANLWSRKNINKYFRRNVYSTSTNQILEEDDIETSFYPLDGTNIANALLASGAIPTVIAPVVNISDDGLVHWDGGITDYHLDLTYKTDQKLILYPHFYHRIIPGWLDKYLKLRKAKSSSLDHTVLLYPSKTFIDSLPTQQISTRKDFQTYFQKDDQRIELWNEIIDKSQMFVADFVYYTNNPLTENDILAL